MQYFNSPTVPGNFIKVCDLGHHVPWSPARAKLGILTQVIISMLFSLSFTGIEPLMGVYHAFCL